MYQTVKLPFVAEESGFSGVLSELRRRQSRAIRTAYNRLVGRMPWKALYQALRVHPVGQGIHSWLLSSAISKARSLYALRPDGGVVFGGRKNLIERSKGKVSSEEWKARRLGPLMIEGHARSYGIQGGNHLVTLDMAQTRLILHTPSGDFVLKLKLSGRSRTYRKHLEGLQARCETFRDTPFSVSLTDKEVRISWETRSTAPKIGRPDRVLALDLNPNRIGWAIVEKAGGHKCRCLAWGIFEYLELNRRLGFAPDDPRAFAQDCKRSHELSILAKKLTLIGRHYQAAAVVIERLALGPASKGRRYNRLVRRCWFRNGFLQPLIRRLEAAGLELRTVNPAYSSMIGNQLWADELKVPDPACAALELGRRSLYLLFTQDIRASSPKSNVGHLRKDGRRAPELSAALGGWKRVWRKLNPTARDTPRRVRRRLLADLRLGPPRRPSIREVRSKVVHFDPRPGASQPFGFDFNWLLAG